MDDDINRIAPARRRAIRRRLLRWYDRHRRDLPWRRRGADAYAQLVAEFMLQQTQVATVVAYYERFLQRFPTVRRLAAAGIDDVLALWSGLGYYRRARHLHAAAKRVVDAYDGVVPSTVEELTTLPGVGRYTAGAIASVAYDTRAPVLDGNVKRVLMRLLAIDKDPSAPEATAELWAWAEELLPVRRCGDFNQALMEIGATVCTPRQHECERCPLRPDCRAFARGLVDVIPRPARRAVVKPAALAVAAIQHGSSMLFVQRPAIGLWAGLWELPSESVAAGEALPAARRRLRRRILGTCRLATRPACTVIRQLTHRTMSFHVYPGATRSFAPRVSTNGQPARWLQPPDLNELGISRATEAILEHLDWRA